MHTLNYSQQDQRCFEEKVEILHQPKASGLEIHKAGIESGIKQKHFF